MPKIKFKRNKLTSRDIRRIGEREQQKEQRQKMVDAFWALSPEERAERIADIEAINKIQRNGITLEDLKRVEVQGQKDGYLAGKIETLKMCYAAICMALHEQYGFGKKRLMDVLNAVDEKVVYSLTSDEAIKEVWDTTGLEISFKDTFPGERITEKGV